MDSSGAIAKYRRAARMTQDALGEAVGVSNRTVSKWESGATSPAVELIPAIAATLSVTPNALFGIDSPPAEDLSEVVRKAVRETLSEILPDMVTEAVENALEDTLEDTVKDALTLCLEEHGIPGGESPRTIAVYSRRDSKTLNCRGELFLRSNNTSDRWFLFSGVRNSIRLGAYDTKEQAEADMKKIFDSLSAGLAKVEI